MVGPALTRLDPRSLTVSLSVPAAPHDGQEPNHCSALAPHSEQTYAVLGLATVRGLYFDAI
jgi:hypothetical protein